MAEKEPQEGTVMDVSTHGGAEINTKADDKRRERLMGISLNKATLEHLYLQWIITLDPPIKQIMNKAFWTFLDYINPVASRMLQESESSLKLRAETLLAERKSGV